MDFWFCETCGKRLTEKDISDGAARNKKLKGVYCQQCSVGVMTMEMDAITLEQLSRTKAHQAVPRSTQTEPAPAQAKASAVRADEHSQSRPPRKTAASNFKVWALVAVAAIFFVVAAIFHIQRQSATHADQADPNNSSSSSTLSSASTKTVSEQRPSLPRVGIVPETDIKGADTKQKESPPVEPVKPATTTIPDSTVKPIESVAEAQPPVAQPVIEKPAVIPPPAVPAPPPAIVAQAAPVATVAPVDPSREKLAPILKDLAANLRQNRFSDAEKLLDEKLRDPELTGISDDLKKEKTDLADVRMLRQSAIDALRAKTGSSLTLNMRGEKMSVTVKSGSNDKELAVALRGGIEMALKADQLDARDVDSFAPVDAAIEKSEDLRRRGLLFLAAGDSVKAEEYFSKAGAAGTPYLQRLASFKLMAKENAALDAWKKAEALYAGKRWKPAKLAYAAFQHDFAGSKAVADNEELLKQRLNAIEEALGLPKESLDLGGGVRLELILIPSGEFEMGSNDGGAEERPVHKVTLSRGFYMGKFLVTQSQFERVIGGPKTIKADLPIDNIYFAQAEEFCKKASELTGRIFRLPTEAEWEYACRAGTKTKYYTGDDAAIAEQAGWFNSNSGGTSHPVGQKKPNAWGLYDMHGNLRQWCADNYAESYLKGPAVDPLNSTRGGGRVLRGGAFLFACNDGRSSSRGKSDANYTDHTIGFRVVVMPASKP